MLDQTFDQPKLECCLEGAGVNQGFKKLVDNQKLESGRQCATVLVE